MRSRSIAVRNQGILFGFILVALMCIFIGCIFFSSLKTQAAPAEISYKYYTSIQVQKGDTLWHIANAYMTEEYADVNEYIEEICSINHIEACEIHSGQYLTIPYYSDQYVE